MRLQSKNKKIECNPKEISLKSFFLGPQAENAPWTKQLLGNVFKRWVRWRKSLFPKDGKAISLHDQKSHEFIFRRKSFEKAAHELVSRFEREVPKFSPRYVGHMFSEISLPALIGHIVALLHNPNNISGESSRVGIQIEDEAVRFLLEMVGYSTQKSAGHFTSGGTIANLEALIRAQSRHALWLSAGASHMGWKKYDESVKNIKNTSISGDVKHSLRPVILVPENKHYSWRKGCHLLGLGAEALWPIALDSEGRLSIESLKTLLNLASAKGRPILLVVSVVGTTELGGIDPANEVQDVLDQWREERGIHIWHHVDGAYGGLFRTLDLKHSKTLTAKSLLALAAVPRVNSITLDPHKLGYVPYASGTFLVRDKRDYYFSTFDDAPYIDFNKNTDRGPFTIEGSRSAAGAAATWMTAKTMGLNPEGYGLLLDRTTRIRKELAFQMIQAKLPIQIAPGCDTNILCFACAKEGEKISISNHKTLQVFQAFSPSENGTFIVSKTSLYWGCYPAYLDQWTSSWKAVRDTNEVLLIRMCMMNPFFGSVETDVNYPELFVKHLTVKLNEISSAEKSLVKKMRSKRI